MGYDHSLKKRSAVHVFITVQIGGLTWTNVSLFTGPEYLLASRLPSGWLNNQESGQQNLLELKHSKIILRSIGN